MIQGLENRRFSFRRSVLIRRALPSFLLALLGPTMVAPLLAVPLRAQVLESAAPAQHLSLGQTVDQVIAIMGQPDQIVDLGARVIYIYKERRIEFTDGRVTSLSEANPCKSSREHGNCVGQPDQAPTRPSDSLLPFKDAFSQDSMLNDKLWSTNTALLRSVADISSSPGSRWIEPKIGFALPANHEQGTEWLGLRMSGITGAYRFTGIQSNESFRAPLTLKAIVVGTVSHGNPFQVFLVSGDLRQLISIAGNLDSSSGYQGVWETVRIGGHSKPEEKIYETPITHSFYSVGIAIDSDGNAFTSFSTLDGQVLATKQVAGLGTGPFYVILAQREGAPYSVGPNEAIWSEISLSGQAVTGGTGGFEEQSSGDVDTAGPAALCLGAGGPGITNNDHGLIRILSGSGSFADLSSSAKVLRVHPGSQLIGSVRLHVVNGGNPGAVAPLIGTVSWGDPSHAFWTIASWVVTGEHDLDSQVRVTVPDTPGTYHILFAMRLELSGADVASGTNWAVHHDTWDDGNDIAQFGLAQILHAQHDGCTTDRWLGTKGYEVIAVPADVITLQVL